MIICLLLYITPVISQIQDTSKVALENETILQAKNTELTNSIKDDSSELIFTPGDALEVKVYPDTLSFPNGIYTIDGQGYAYLPILGYQKITDKTVNELESLLKKEYVNLANQRIKKHLNQAGLFDQKNDASHLSIAEKRISRYSTKGNAKNKKRKK